MNAMLMQVRGQYFRSDLLVVGGQFDECQHHNGARYVLSHQNGAVVTVVLAVLVGFGNLSGRTLFL